MNKVWAYIAGIGGLITVLVAMGWGVPHYIKTEVTAQVTANLTAAGIETIDDTADTNKATITAIQSQLSGMEDRMIERDRLFMEYLERQASD